MNGEQRILRAWLEHRNVRCPCCKYDLHGLTNCRCPECGSAIHLSVAAQAPLCLRVAIVALGAALGVEAIHEFNCLRLFLAENTSHPWSVITSEVLFHSVFVAVLAVVMSALLWVRKRWWRLGESGPPRGTEFGADRDKKEGATG